MIWIWDYEEIFYHSVLFQEIKFNRRILRNDRVVLSFRLRAGPRQLIRSMKMWKEFCTQRKSRREGVVRTFHNHIRGKLIPAMRKWWSYTVVHRSSCLLQRIGRGYIGRQRVRFIRFLHYCATRIEAFWRGQRLRKQYLQFIEYRNWCVVSIQR